MKLFKVKLEEDFAHVLVKEEGEKATVQNLKEPFAAIYFAK